MPAAAVIPAPIVYIKVVAVKKLVVELLAARSSAFSPAAFAVIRLRTPNNLQWLGGGSRHFTLKKLECFKQVIARIL